MGEFSTSSKSSYLSTETTGVKALQYSDLVGTLFVPTEIRVVSYCSKIAS